MDVVDRAQALEEALRDNALSLLTRHATLRQAGMECLRCDTEIDERRRQAVPGCCLCVTCQELVERMRR